MKPLFKGLTPDVFWLVLLGGGLLWAEWPVLLQMADQWSTDPRYAHGYLVPLFGIGLLWVRRNLLLRSQPRPSTWGLVFLGIGGACQLAGGYFRLDWGSGVALLPYLAGICVLAGGWPALRWAWPSIAFSLFMIPLPFQAERALGGPLQRIATLASTYSLQTLGFMAFSEGNVIQLSHGEIGVVDACSGLSMVITFLALSTAAAIVVKRPLLDRIVLVVSSLPVALVANIARITLTGVLHETAGSRIADTFYHDLAGWLMIPLALLLYWLEILVLTYLLVEPEGKIPLRVGLPVMDHSGMASTTGTKRFKPALRGQSRA